MNLLDRLFLHFLPHRCPHCHQFHAGESIGEKFLRMHSKGKGFGKIWMNDHWLEAPIVERHGVYEVTQRCKFCEHEWVITQTRKLS